MESPDLAYIHLKESNMSVCRSNMLKEIIKNAIVIFFYYCIILLFSSIGLQQ